MRVWAIPSGELVATRKCSQGQLLAIRFSPAGDLFVTVGRRGGLGFWNTTDFELLTELPYPGQTYWCLDISPDGRTLAAGTWGKAIEIWDIPSRETMATLTGHTELISAVKFNPEDGEAAGILASASTDGKIKLWDTESGLCLVTLDAQAGSASGVWFVPVPRSGAPTLLSKHADGTMSLWNLSYYDRHIAGDLSHQVKRLAPENLVRR